MDIAERNRLNVKSRWRKVQKAEKEYIKNNSGRYIHLKARILGYLAGDGNIYIGKTKSNQHYSARFFPDHHSLIKPFCYAFKLVYGKKPLVYKRNNFYCVTVDSKIIIQDIIRQANLGVKEWRVPFSLLVNKKAKREWLRAFFDSEAYVMKGLIKIQTVNRLGMMDVKNLLEEFGVSSNYYMYTPKNGKWNTNHILYIRRDRKAYLNQIGFNHAIKRENLKKA